MNNIKIWTQCLFNTYHKEYPFGLFLEIGGRCGGRNADFEQQNLLNLLIYNDL